MALAVESSIVGDGTRRIGRGLAVAGAAVAAVIVAFARWGPDWPVWRVRHAAGLVTGPAAVRGLGSASFVLDFMRSGTATVRIRLPGDATAPRCS